ncbi:MAG TPA: hypothetical protein VG944_03185 [Fimbriimonas sp.]|nr:hypothetical protein [Fimbriimonas sp.]
MAEVSTDLQNGAGRARWRLNPVAQLLICFVIAFALALSRRHAPWYPYAEDGIIFYQQANDFGIRSLIIPDGGYLHVGLRIMALALAQFPPSLMPFAMVATALAIQAAVATFIFSDGISNLVPSQFYRGLFAFIYIGLPDVDEVHGHFVNSQWHLALLSALLIFGRVPVSRAGKIVRLALVTILSLTGPFVAFLLPLTAFKYYRSRSRYNLGLLLCSIPAFIQICSVFLSDRPTRPWHDLARPMAIPRIFGGRSLLSAAIAPSLFENHYADEPVLWAALFGTVVLCAYAIVMRKRFALLLLYLGGCILLTSLRGGVGSMGTRLNPEFSNRYYFIFGFGLIVTVILMVASEKRWARVATACCAAAVLAVSWQLPSPVNFWPKYQAALQTYDRAAPGTVVVFPEVPKEWSFRVRKR